MTTALAAKPQTAFRALLTVNDLRHALTFTAWSVPRRPSMQVLLGVLLTPERAGLEFRTTDYDTTSSITIPSAVMSGQPILVPHQQFARMIAVLPAGTDVLLERDGGSLRILGSAPDGEVRFHLPLMDVEDYPADGELPVLLPFLQADDLRHLARVTCAAGRDVTLPVLTGVHIDCQDGHATAAATDRYRLAVAEAPNVTLPKGTKLLPPAVLLARAAETFKKGNVQVHADTDKIRFSDGTRSITGRLLQGEFPKYRALIPKDTTASVTVDRDRLMTAVQQAGAAIRKHGFIRCLFSTTDPLRLSGHHASEPTDADPQGHVTLSNVHAVGTDLPYITAFNEGYLHAGLSSLPAGDVVISVQSPTRPAIINSASTDERPYTYLIMPVRLQS